MSSSEANDKAGGSPHRTLLSEAVSPHGVNYLNLNLRDNELIAKHLTIIRRLEVLRLHKALTLIIVHNHTGSGTPKAPMVTLTLLSLFYSDRLFHYSIKCCS